MNEKWLAYLRKHAESLSKTLQTFVDEKLAYIIGLIHYYQDKICIEINDMKLEEKHCIVSNSDTFCGSLFIVFNR